MQDLTSKSVYDLFLLIMFSTKKINDMFLKYL